LFSLAIGAGLAWSDISFAYGVAALISALGVVLATRAIGRTIATAEQKTGPASSARGWGILDQRSFSALFATVFLDTMVQAGVLVFIAFLMIAKGFTVGTATFATVVLLVGGIFGKAGCGYLADRMGVRPAYGLIQILTAVGIVLLVMAPGWTAFAILFPLGAVTQGSTSITYGFVADLVHPDRMARGYALMYGASSLSAAAGPFAFGVIADGAGIETAILAMAVMSLTAIPPLYMMAKPKPA
ncbi:MAG: MFS transporter, partial [Pseudomonadota bacterium]